MVPFWIQVHGLPLFNMTTKNAIAIGKGLGHLLKVEASGGAFSTFRSYLLILVEIDSNKPLNQGFNFFKQDGDALGLVLNMRDLMPTAQTVASWGINNPSALPLKLKDFLKGTKSLLRSPFFQIFNLLSLLFPIQKNFPHLLPPD